MNWEMIISGCAKGDRRYQKVIFEEYNGILLKVAFRYVSTYEQALELTRRGFLIMFNGFGIFRSGQNVITKESLFVWIKRTFIMALIDQILPELDLYEAAPIPEFVWKEFDRPFTDVEMESIKLIKILKELPTLCRLVFNLNVMDGFTHSEIGGILGITVACSKKNLVRAREYLSRSFVTEKSN